MTESRDIYFDHNATTAARQEVIEAMLPWFREHFGNASSLHRPGQTARDAVERARLQVAELIGAEPEEIVFTSGGTESDNIAVRGTLSAFAGRFPTPHVITSSIEHPAILRTCRMLEREGVEVTFLPCDSSGVIKPEDLAASFRDNTVLVSIMLGNNETGAVQPVARLAALAREHGAVFHCDAVQGVGKIPVDAAALGADLLSVSAHKFYGPKGVGCLYVRRGTELHAVYTGGHQEKAIRPGTENVPAIVGFGEACRITARDLPEEMKRITGLRDRLEKGILRAVDDVWINAAGSERMPNTCSVTVTRIEGEAMTLNLGMLGFAMSSGSACATGDSEPSHVLLAMGLDQVDAQGALRISLGIENTEEEIDSFLDVFPGVVERLRSMSPLQRRP